MSGAAYRIADEPQPSSLDRLVVNPVWPFFALMFVGAWLALPWFLVNSALLGSPTQRRETSIAVATPLLVGLVMFFVTQMIIPGWADEASRVQTFRYLKLLANGATLCSCYWLYVLQNRVFGIWQYFGREPAPGYVVVILGYLLKSQVKDVLFDLDPEMTCWILAVL